MYENDKIMKRHFTVTHNYKSDEEGPEISICHKLEHIHFMDMPGESIPQNEEASDALMHLAINECVPFLEA